jgi:5-methylcytosine-specific restriction endonuclease McrA|tara:strand:- start:71 stop:352 length:282 start_codon:yes stop_codon:yes gene_type:complete
LIYAPNHHLADTKGYAPEHRLVAEAQLGRTITKDDHVHHINGDKTDNRPANLVVLSAQEHSQHHSSSGGKAAWQGHRKNDPTCDCKRCGSLSR